MREQTRARLVTVIVAAGLVGGMALGNPSALAEPDILPPPAPINPAAAPLPPSDPFAPPPADPLAPPPPAPLAFPPPPPGDPFAPPPADPLAAAQLTVIPEGTPAGQNPTPYTGQPVFAPPSFNSTNGSMVGVAKPIIINFARPIADRPMAEQAIHISTVTAPSLRPRRREAPGAPTLAGSQPISSASIPQCLARHNFHGEWNYTLHPKPRHAEAR